jgi:hypothetical protein
MIIVKILYKVTVTNDTATLFKSYLNCEEEMTQERGRSTAIFN